MFVPARVTDVLTDDARAEPWSEGLRLGAQTLEAQTLEVELLRGPHRGTVLETVHYLSAYSNIDCRVGTRIIVRLDYDDGGEPYILSVPAYDRGPVLAGALLVFALLLNIDCRVGTRIIVRLDYDDGGEPYILSVPAYDRGPVLAGALLVFALLLIALGGRKGVMALLGWGIHWRASGFCCSPSS